MGDGVLALGRTFGIDSHLQTISFVSPDVADDRAFCFLQASPD